MTRGLSELGFVSYHIRDRESEIPQGNHCPQGCGSATLHLYVPTPCMAHVFPPVTKISRPLATPSAGPW